MRPLPIHSVTTKVGALHINMKTLTSRCKDLITRQKPRSTADTSGRAQDRILFLKQLEKHNRKSFFAFFTLDPQNQISVIYSPPNITPTEVFPGLKQSKSNQGSQGFIDSS